MKRINFILFFACFISTISFSQMKAKITSDLMYVTTPLEVPIAKAATDVNNTSFTANWNTISNVDGYFIDLYTYTAIDLTKDSTISLLNENFDNFTAGSLVTPDNTNIGNRFIDPSYTNIPGWYGSDIYQAGGNMYMPTDAWIFTPSINLTTGSKHFTVKITFASASTDAEVMIAHTPDGKGKSWESGITASDFISADLNDDGIADGFYVLTNIQSQTYTYDFYEGDVYSCVQIYIQTGNVTISNIEIIQDQKTGDKIENYLTTITINGGNISSENITGVDENTEYAYRLRSFTGTLGNYVYSNASNEIIVDKSSGNHNIKKNSFIIYSKNGIIYVKLIENDYIKIYNTKGQLIKSVQGTEGINEVQIPYPTGIYYVKIGEESNPIIL